MAERETQQAPPDTSLEKAKKTTKHAALFHRIKDPVAWANPTTRLATATAGPTGALRRKRGEKYEQDRNWEYCRHGLAILAAAVAFGQFQGRLAVIEGDHARAKKIMREAGAAVIEKAQSYIVDFHEKECHWLDYLGRAPEENIQKCPAGFYAKGLGFHHEGGQNYTYQMSYRLYCCALTPFSSENG